MAIFLFNLFSWLVFLVLLSVLSLLFLWMWGNLRAKVPFVGVPIKTLKDIEIALLLKEGNVFYDLGCGDGRVLFYLSKNNPKVEYIGIENSLFPFILASVSNWWQKKINNINNIKIIKGDFFKIDLSKATHIFTYLYPNVMDDLLPKFDKELKNGARLVSMSFHFTNKRELSEIDLKRGKYQIAKKIYVYEF